MDRPAYLTTREVAALLRLKPRKVYALAASGALPCRKVTGKLLFPRAAVEAIVAGASLPGSDAGARAEPPEVVAGSYDPLLDWAIRQAGSGLATLVEGSGAGLARMLRGGAAAAGLHLAEPEGYNTARVAAAWAERPALRPLVLVEWAHRRTGLMLHPKAGIHGLAGLAGRAVMPRQQGSGGQALLDRLAQAPDWPAGRVHIYARAARSEAEAALAVARGVAAAAPGIEAMARQHGLRFLAVETERFDLLVDRRAYFEPPLQGLWRFARSAAFAAEAEALGGYDIAGFGTVHWNAPLVRP